MADGGKPFEVRVDDRGIEVGDLLELVEVVPGPGDRVRETGRRLQRRVTYRLDTGDLYELGLSRHGDLPRGFCVLGLDGTIADQDAARRLVVLDRYLVCECTEPGTGAIDGRTSSCTDCGHLWSHHEADGCLSDPVKA